ncbi:hypothetical protein [uncultured Shewanella sp.]|uniref:hypothetical protein n=1 Tax=uncultured Shewanella sp. TaxID=173975 RepID=UPI0026148F68|nr:hypothetical protein [uncultured Shewanella sp.]
MVDELTPRQRADRKNNEKRKGQPTFAAVRFNDDVTQTASDKKQFVANVVKQHGGNREDALMMAFQLLEERLKKGR